jgi:hypothetical protein
MPPLSNSLPQRERGLEKKKGSPIKVERTREGNDNGAGGFETRPYENCRARHAVPLQIKKIGKSLLITFINKGETGERKPFTIISILIRN